MNSRLSKVNSKGKPRRITNEIRKIRAFKSLDFLFLFFFSFLLIFPGLEGNIYQTKFFWIFFSMIAHSKLVEKAAYIFKFYIN